MPFGEPRRDALGERLDVFRGCGDHVYQNADCPHCTNNSAVVDKILQHLASQRQELGESPGRARSHLEMAEVRIAQMQQSNGELRAQAAAQGDLVARLGEWAKKIVALSAGWDDDGSTGPLPPLSWESVGRLAMDYANALLAEISPSRTP